MEAVFRAPTPYMNITISIPIYAEGNRALELKENRKPQLVGIEYWRCYFCEGREHNQLTLQDARDIVDMRAYIERKEGFMEVSCDEEAAAMLGGSNKTNGRDHEQHKKELQNKYGDGEEDRGLSEWDRKHLSKMLKG